MEPGKEPLDELCRAELRQATPPTAFTAVQRIAVDLDCVHHRCYIHGTRKRLDEIRAEIPPL